MVVLHVLLSPRSCPHCYKVCKHQRSIKVSLDVRTRLWRGGKARQWPAYPPRFDSQGANFWVASLAALFTEQCSRHCSLLNSVDCSFPSRGSVRGIAVHPLPRGLSLELSRLAVSTSVCNLACALGACVCVVCVWCE